MDQASKFPQFYADPDNWVVYGPDANCTLALCPVTAGVYQYRPSIAANVVFLVLFGIAMIIHAVQALKYRTFTFGSLMVIGCISEILGYGGRILLWQNPFSFNGFLLQISESRIPHARAGLGNEEQNRTDMGMTQSASPSAPSGTQQQSTSPSPRCEPTPPPPPPPPPSPLPLHKLE